LIYEACDLNGKTTEDFDAENNLRNSLRFYLSPDYIESRLGQEIDTATEEYRETYACPQAFNKPCERHAILSRVTRPPARELLTYLAPYDPQVSNLALALRQVVLEEAPKAVESLVNGYAVSIGFSFTGKPLKDGFCHVVTYADHVNLGFNRGAQLSDPEHILEGSGKLIRHIRVRNHDDLDRPLVRRFLRAAIDQVGVPPVQPTPKKQTKSRSRRTSVSK
jgi:hypothetical protein